MDNLRVAGAQITCRPGKLVENLEKHRLYAHRAAAAGACAICFPELSLCGYPGSATIAQELAQPLEGELGRGILTLSAEAGLVVLAGLLERDRSGVLYNTQLVASPTGLLGIYRKTHVSSSEIDRFSPGDDLPVFAAAGMRFGIQICYDNHFPESSRILALRGAEVVFCPYGSPGPGTPEGMAAKRARWLRYLPARAFDNSIYLVVVNQVGRNEPAEAAAGAGATLSSTPRDTHSDLAEFPGGSLALNPWGEVIAEAPPDEHLMIIDLSAATFEEKRRDPLQFFTHFRRPELYADLARPSRVPRERQVE
ncbi:MAG: hypothetical protein HYS12_00310 [Planctomycetes bacterium]|nr:hypothetical protein [Planctomycetota bacterium]